MNIYYMPVRCNPLPNTHFEASGYPMVPIRAKEELGFLIAWGFFHVAPREDA